MKCIYVLCFVIVCISCSKDEPAGSNCDATITYTNKVAAIINKSCAVAGCHVSGGTGNGVFTTFAAVKAKVNNGSFNRRVLQEKSMPVIGTGVTLSAEEYNILSCWVETGAN